MLCDEQGFSVRSPPLGPILFPFHVHQPLFFWEMVVSKFFLGFKTNNSFHFFSS